MGELARRGVTGCEGGVGGGAAGGDLVVVDREPGEGDVARVGDRVGVGDDVADGVRAGTRAEEDRQPGDVLGGGEAPGRGAVLGGGIGTIVLVLVAMYFGIDPTPLLQGVQSGSVS